VTARRRRTAHAGAVRPPADERASQTRLDLAVLVADKDIEAAVTGLFARAGALGVRSPTRQVFKHPNRDNGCFSGAHSFLRAQANRFDHALVLFDRHGCGRDARAREALEEEVERRLDANGWAERAAAVVLDPELEVWVWSPSAWVDDALGWRGRQPSLRQALAGEGLLAAGDTKPADPKRAVERALEIVRKPRSSAIYEELARAMPVAGCHDSAFRKLLDVLRRWFPAAT
jgi:hypothetical protein